MLQGKGLGGKMPLSSSLNMFFFCVIFVVTQMLVQSVGKDCSLVAKTRIATFVLGSNPLVGFLC